MAITIVITILFIDKKTVDATGTAFDYVEQLGSGINMGNIFETGLEDVLLDDGSITIMVEQVKSQGYSSIRLPVTWQGHFDKETKVIEAEYLSKVEQIVKIAISKDINVVLTMYDDSWRWISDAKNSKENLKLYQTLWKQIAEYMAGYNNKLSFEAINAPFFEQLSTKEQQKLLDEFNQSFVKTVRSVGGNNKKRYLLLPLLNGQVNEENSKSMVSFYKDLKDENVIATVQYYGLWNFSVNAAKATTFHQDAKQHMQDFFQYIQTYFVKNKIPVVCGEYGLYGYPTYEHAIIRGERLKYFYQFATKAQSAKLSSFLWDTGVLFNRTTGQWADEDLAYIIKNSNLMDYSYGDTDAVYIIDGKEIKDVTISLTLNEGKFSSLVGGKTPLTPNKDYYRKENKLTLSKTYLDTLKKEPNGHIQTLEVVFTKGPTWKIDLYKVGKPSFVKTGTKEETLSIPIKEAGDTIIAMESFGKDKKPVGPLDWTTYQEYGYSFLPDYENHLLHLTSEFLSSLPMKKEVVLRFHFKSGQTVDYSIIKDGEGVRELSYDLSNQPDDSVSPTYTPDLQRLVEKENQQAVEKEKAKADAIHEVKSNNTDRGTLGWKLLFISFTIMVVLGFAIMYIYHAHREEALEDKMEETEDQLDQKIHKILVDKMDSDA